MNQLKTNKDQCVMLSVSGVIHHPTMRLPGYRVSSDGSPKIVPSVGGIAYNAKIGDPCMNMIGDHIEPGVSMKNPKEREDAALNILACVGNEAIIQSGDGKHRKGVVTGKHGGINHVMVHFDDETLNLLSTDDKILVKAFGQGLQLLDYPQVSVMNIDPALLEKLPIKEEDNTLFVPVKAIVPAQLMGSGLGSTDMHAGDYDIMTRDEATIKQYKLDQLRYGDFVFIEDHCNTYGPDYIQGAGTFGIIVHSDSYQSGHGPGVSVLLTSRTSILKPYLDDKANLIHYI
jgi:hypothetical protein